MFLILMFCIFKDRIMKTYPWLCQYGTMIPQQSDISLTNKVYDALDVYIVPVPNIFSIAYIPQEGLMFVVQYSLLVQCFTEFCQKHLMLTVMFKTANQVVIKHIITLLRLFYDMQHTEFWLTLHLINSTQIQETWVVLLTLFSNL